MQVNGLRFSDEFRMRSPVVWLCIAAVVLCALSVESGVQRNYHLIHGQTGPIFRSILPTIGYASIGPQIVGRRLERQGDDYEDEDDEEEEEEDEEYDPDYIYGQPAGPEQDPDPYAPYEGEQIEEEDEEEEDEEDDEETRDEDEIEGRQAFINNHYIDQSYVQSQENRVSNVPRQSNRVKSQENYNPYVDQPYVLRQDNRVKPQNNNNNRVPVNKNDKKPVQATTNKPNSNNINQQNRPNRRKPKPVPNGARPVVSGQQATPPININNNRISQGNVPQRASNNQHGGNKQKLQLRPVATSTQFIATPVADLILRLSISLAKPMGHGNATNFNVPVRIHQGVVKSVGENHHVINLGPRKTENATPKTDVVISTTTVSPKIPIDEVIEEEEEEEDDKEPTSAAPEIELPRK